MNNLFAKRLLWGVRVKDFLAWSVFFWTFICIYLSVLVFSMIVPPAEKSYWAMRVLRETLIMDGIRFFMMIGIWWLFFRKLRYVSFTKKMWLHIPMLFIYLVVAYKIGSTTLIWIGQPMKTTRNIGLFDCYMPGILYLVQMSVFHTYHFWRESKKQLEREKDLMELAYQSEINALKAQIQPHFLFNTLNSISASVSPQQEKTRVLIAELADTFRYALRSSQEDLVPLSSELQFISTYLDLEKERFRERLHVNIQVDKQVEEAKIPPMLLQPLVENSLKYGISPMVNGGSIHIICQEHHGHLLISVKDTGGGYTGNLHDLKNTSGVGLKNIRKRLEKLYGEGIHIERNQPQGLSVIFKIPM
ncbi:MAG: histidine kinase [Chitinophagaceae bacterium]